MTSLELSTSPRADATAWWLVFCAWLLASVSTLGALFFGEIMQLPPCTLCWYQRIFMFPLALILPLGLFPFDCKVARYGLALSVPGLLLAAFHLLVAAGVIPQAIQPCSQGIPCSTTVIVWFGFVTIPLLSAIAFGMVTALLLASFFRGKRP